MNFFKIFSFPEIESTNKKASSLLENDNIDEDFVVMADFQNSGKGMDNNKWHSEKDKNALFSIVKKFDNFKAEKQFLLTQIVSTSIISFLKKKFDIICQIKWPNDIYFEEKKLAGILISNKILGQNITHTIIGIGLNVNEEIFPTELPNPISLKNILRRDIDVDNLRNELIINILDNLTFSNFILKKEETDNIYRKNLLRFNKKNVYEYGGKQEEMTIIGYDKFGRLRLKRADNSEILCDIKEIKYIFE